MTTLLIWFEHLTYRLHRWSEYHLWQRNMIKVQRVPSWWEATQWREAPPSLTEQAKRIADESERLFRLGI